MTFTISAFVTFITIIDPVGLAPVVIGLTALIAAWLVMCSSLWIIHHVGRTTILVLSRILGILLAALAIQFVLNGFTEFILINKPGK